jgi:hypothetical protein
MIRAKFSLLLFLALSFSCLGQVLGDHYQTLKDALGLSDSQVRELHTGSLQLRILDDSQRARLTAIEKVFQSYELASQAFTLGLISERQWRGTSLCYYPITSYASELGLSDSQVHKFHQLQHDAREPFNAHIAEKENHRLGLLNSGISADSPTVTQLMSDIGKLQKEAADARPPRHFVLAILDDARKARFAEFETALHVATDAIELGLIPAPPNSEALCF